MHRQIRIASLEDLPSIMTVIDAAKGIMRSSGNVNQWKEVTLFQGSFQNADGLVLHTGV